MGCCLATSSSRVGSVTVNERVYKGDGRKVIVEERSCTDVVFFFLFFGYVIFLVISVSVAGGSSDIRRLLYGEDKYGNICDGKLTSNRNCFTGKTSQSSDGIKVSVTGWLQDVGEDITRYWPHILLVGGISIGLSIVLMVVFRFFATCIIWIVLLVVAGASIALTIFLWLKWQEMNQETTWLVAAIIVTIFTIVYLLIVLIMRKRISLVGALFQEAGKVMGAMPFLLIQPLWTFVAMALVCLFLLLGFVCVQSAIETKEVGADGTVKARSVNRFYQVLRWFLLFGFLWMAQFVLACHHLVTSGAVCNWYFTRDKRKLSSPILKSLCFTIRYHLGSAALGSLIIAIIQLIRLLFRLLQKSIDENGRCDIFWKVFQCCLGCFESFIKFLSRNAYIMISITGESFCTSCRRAFSLLSANALRLAAVECIGDFVLFVGKLGIVVATAFIAIEILKNVEGINYLWVPVALSCVLAFLISHCFLSVYEMTIDSLLLCFCQDCEMNDGISRPYYMSRSLMMFLENTKKMSAYKKTN